MREYTKQLLDDAAETTLICHILFPHYPSRCQHLMREYTKQLLDDAAETTLPTTEDDKAEMEKALMRTYISIARNLADPMRTQDHMKK